MHRSFDSTTLAAAVLAACAGLAVAQPANNLCANAQVIGSNATVNGTNVNATTDGPLGGCGGSGNDVWYVYSHPANGTTQSLTIATCAGANYDSVIRVFTGNCGGLTQTVCNDDSCGLQSSVVQSVTPGVTYYISVSGYNGATGTFTLTTSTVAAPPRPTALPLPPLPPMTTGPDIIVGDLIDVQAWGTTGAVAAYSVGTTSCNNGTANVLWVANTNQHPVIGQNFYRYADNRFELVGISWLKHGFTALTQSLCNTCSGQGGAVLGVGCSDPYGAGLNGSQGGLGPRSHINATNGYYPYPFTNPPAPYIVPAAAEPVIGRRLQALTADLAVSGRYFAECQYVNADEATFNGATLATNGLNNVSYREVFITNGVLQPNYFIGGTARGWPALKAWTYLDPTVVLNSYDHTVSTVTSATNPTLINVATRFWVGAKVVDNGNGTWTYNYTIFNVNSDIAMGKFELPSTDITATAPYQRIPMYHSSEPATFNDAWSYSADSAGVRWNTPQTFAQNANSSALRYSTSATFSVTTDTAPVTGTAKLYFFKNNGSLNLTGLPIPGNGSPDCAADFNGDALVDFFDYLDFVDAFSANDPSADFNGDAVIDFFDYLDFVDAFSTGC